jgi:hypothetical protein
MRLLGFIPPQKGYAPFTYQLMRSRSHPAEGSSDMKYEAPVITDYGTLVALTAGQSEGEETDRDFPAHTKKSDLTFS